MSDFKEKINSFFFLGDQESPDKKESKEEPVERSKQERINYPKVNSQAKKSGGENVLTMHQMQEMKKPRITIIEPRLYSEVQEVSDVLLANQSVIINFRRMDNEQATKMIDFLMGVTYAIKGDIQRLGEEIFICTPQSVEVDGSELSEFTESLL